MEFRLDAIESSVCVQLNNGGNSLPLGRRVLGSRNSSKKPWAHASRGVTRAPGVYSRRRETRVIASTGVRGRKTFDHGCALIWGNLNSV